MLDLYSFILIVYLFILLIYDKIIFYRKIIQIIKYLFSDKDSSITKN
jgi:hypothetical protein